MNEANVWIIFAYSYNLDRFKSIKGNSGGEKSFGHQVIKIRQKSGQN